MSKGVSWLHLGVFALHGAFQGVLGSITLIGLLHYWTVLHVPVAWIINTEVICTAFMMYGKIIFSYYSDRTETPIGRRKPYIVSCALVRVAAVFLICNPPKLHVNGLIVYYLVLRIVITICMAGETRTFLPWLWEITSTLTQLTAILVVHFLSTALVNAVCLTLVKAHLISWAMLGAVFAWGASVSVLLILAVTPTEVHTRHEVQPPLIPSFRLCALSKDFRAMFCALLFTDMGTDTTLPSMYLLLLGFTHTYTHVHITYQAQYSSFFLTRSICSLVGGFVTLPLSLLTLGWYDKHKLYSLLLLCWGVCGVLGFVFSFVDMYGYMWTMICVGIVTQPLLLINRLFEKELIVRDTYHTGKHRASMYQTCLDLPEGLLSSVFAALPQMLMPLTGWKELNTHTNTLSDDRIDHRYKWTDETIWLLRIIGPLAITLCAIAAYIAMRGYYDDPNPSPNRNPGIYSTQEPESAHEHQMLMLHLSQSELRTLAQAAVTDTQTYTHTHTHTQRHPCIRQMVWVNAVLVCVSAASLVSVMLSTCISAGQDWTTLLMLLGLGLSLVLVYGLLRVRPLKVLYCMRGDVVKAMATLELEVEICDEDVHTYDSTRNYYSIDSEHQQAEKFKTQSGRTPTSYNPNAYPENTNPPLEINTLMYKTHMHTHIPRYVLEYGVILIVEAVCAFGALSLVLLQL